MDRRQYPEIAPRIAQCGHVRILYHVLEVRPSALDRVMKRSVNLVLLLGMLGRVLGEGEHPTNVAAPEVVVAVPAGGIGLDYLEERLLGVLEAALVEDRVSVGDAVFVTGAPFSPATDDLPVEQCLPVVAGEVDRGGVVAASPSDVG